MGKNAVHVIQSFFDQALHANQDESASVAAVKTLLHFLPENATTIQELMNDLKEVIEVLKAYKPSAEVESVSDIFIRYITLWSAHFPVLEEAKKDLKNRGSFFLDNVTNCKKKVARTGQNFITDGSKILTHSVSRVVYYTLCEAKKQNKRFTVYVTQSAPDNTGEEMCRRLSEEGIENILILDAAIGYYMEKADLVLVGAESVVHNGGVVNKVGTYPLALAAKAVNKPFYVLVESYKFSKNIPLKQEDIHAPFKEASERLSEYNRLSWSSVDYTHPRYITLLLTDLGPLATAAVSDVLMQLYL
ncbi:Translation initiation factor eIF-2B subunit alpha [Halotydeus destructor]|nr:Translation initiation factor eIF-2B subunit alpha [Halotydeus destructor]